MDLKDLKRMKAIIRAILFILIPIVITGFITITYNNVSQEEYKTIQYKLKKLEKKDSTLHKQRDEFIRFQKDADKHYGDLKNNYNAYFEKLDIGEDSGEALQKLDSSYYGFKNFLRKIELDTTYTLFVHLYQMELMSLWKDLEKNKEQLCQFTAEIFDYANCLERLDENRGLIFRLRQEINRKEIQLENLKSANTNDRQNEIDNLEEDNEMLIEKLELRNNQLNEIRVELKNVCKERSVTRKDIRIVINHIDNILN